MKKAIKKMAMGGDVSGIQDMAFIEGRDFPVGGNEANNYLGGPAAMVGVKPTPIYPDMSKMQKANLYNAKPPEIYGYSGDNMPAQRGIEFTAAKKGGSIKKAAGGSAKGSDWHGFGSSKTGKNNHGF
jgi:hypothetical protein